MPSNRKILGGLVRLGLSAALAAGLSIVAAQAEDKTDLVIAYPQEPPNWNYIVTSSAAILVPTFMNVIQPLVELNQNSTVSPLLAESWEISADGKEIIFHLREATFHDGTSLDAADVVYSLGKNKASPVGLVSVALQVIETIEAVDDRTVRLTLSNPSQRLLKELGQAPGIIVPEGAYETYDPATTMVGTGPFAFTEHAPDVQLVFTRFDDYWGDASYFQKVVYRYIPDETAATNALLAGEVDIVGAILGEGLDRVESVVARPEFELLLPSPINIAFVFLYHGNEALRDLRVRQAIAHGFDREALLIAGQSGYGDVICQHILPASEPWNNGYCPYEYNPDRSRELLAEAGYGDGLTLDFPFLTIGEFPALKEVLVALMADIGITLNARPMDLPTWLEQVWNGDSYEFANITGGSKIETFSCGGGFVPIGKPDAAEFCIPEFDELVKTSDAILDADEYVAAMVEMTKIFADAAWHIPLYVKSSPTLYRADLKEPTWYPNRVGFDLRGLAWVE